MGFSLKSTELGWQYYPLYISRGQGVLWLYPVIRYNVLREGVVSPLLDGDYSCAGGSISIGWYDDHVAITNIEFCYSFNTSLCSW